MFGTLTITQEKVQRFLRILMLLLIFGGVIWREVSVLKVKLIKSLMKNLMHTFKKDREELKLELGLLNNHMLLNLKKLCKLNLKLKQKNFKILK